jgi:CRP-like cAMP-binding protein
MSRPTRAHAEIVRVQVPFDVAPNRVRDALRRAVHEVPRILAEPAPVYRIHRFADSGVEFEVKFWIDQLVVLDDIRSDVMIRIWYRFQREGIAFLHPVVDVRSRRPRGEASPQEREAAVLARLRTAPFFRALPEEAIAPLARDAGVVRFGAGERVVTRGDPGEACYVVDEGRLAVVIDESGIEREVAVLAPGDLFGEMSLLTGEPRSATVRALEDARLVVVGSSTLRTALERAPDLAQRLAEVAALRREGLLGAKAALDAESKHRVEQHARNLGALIREFFRLPEPGAPAGPGGPSAAR